MHELPEFEFHVSREARDLYQFEDTWFSLTGRVIFANFNAARLFAQKMNQRRDLVNTPEQAVKAGQLNALALIHEVLHSVMVLYREQVDPQVMARALSQLEVNLGQDTVERTLAKFVDEFPPVAVYRRQQDAESYLQGETSGISNREIVLEEMLMLWLSNVNPAAAPFLDLFDDHELERSTAYEDVIAGLNELFGSQSSAGMAGEGLADLLAAGRGNQSLLEILRAPARAAPHSLTAQLEYILDNWSALLQQLTLWDGRLRNLLQGKYLYRLLGGLDLIKEEQKVTFLGAGPAQVPVYDFAGQEAEPERFSADLDWMPRLVLIAKSTYVWLDQLSKKYGGDISRLDQIPDEELDLLAERGFTGLWLIGLWQRSEASKRIKQLMGNADAVASAYSLYDYFIATDLGGDEAYANLKARAWQRGIRLASDMVPNHMGIDSRWVIEHPDWFISLDYPPYPAYTFNGPDLSSDPRVGLFLEDHYYDRTDAAVVFKRVDRATGDVKYIYHGNDGTSFPWNDTAQLNYLKPEVREAVIQTILHVARQFPVIRFDAAMTLAKRHYSRLWFPQPGQGGDIPSRAEFALTKEEFDRAMPQEFWREVVDRVQAEAPDTLLLAEAFWLMEGYFVRTLGMHRVYNSAFMVLLRDQENAKYRSVMKNTLEFDPEVLKRYVNFMNNPDERTAVDQFGKEDRYFGICTLMATMPGLPMFGHGQVEGFTERYGMEYRRALKDEQPDPYLVERHAREIFPLLHRRYLFAGVENFLLYDFVTPDGTADEDVFAYSNRVGDERSLVIFHNKYASVRGWIKTSVTFRAKSGNSEGRLVQRTLAKGLALVNDEETFVIFRDQASGLEYIRNSKELTQRGLYIELGAYKYHVFLDFRLVQDNAFHQYRNLAEYLGGRGVPSIEGALRETFLQVVHQPFKELVSTELLESLFAARSGAASGSAKPRRKLDAELLDQVERKITDLAREAKNFGGGTGDETELAQELRSELETMLELQQLKHRFPLPRSRRYGEALKYLQDRLGAESSAWYVALGWLFVHALGKIADPENFEQQSRTWIDEWQFGKIIAAALIDLGLGSEDAWRGVTLIKLITTHQRWLGVQRAAEDGSNGAGLQASQNEALSCYRVLQTWLQDDEVQAFIGVNRYQDVLWFNQEAFEQLLWWMYLVAVVQLTAEGRQQAEQVSRNILTAYEIIKKLQLSAERSKYQLEKLLSHANADLSAKPSNGRRASTTRSKTRKKAARREA